eukprot:CAMPEP_0118946836 /NCGR_PEP_ID=MMETSP1169-20130426/44930_1 /TAXON_ID=36882 /ORGANISM="Pyramimonas obovata, Strain CCMP722" /LENGTH=33 /DNA_ID= /DNA_START= /DNA_END= /DNA_ORIENTATION=
MGSKYDMVLPEPVCDCSAALRPDRKIGKAASCT